MTQDCENEEDLRSEEVQAALDWSFAHPNPKNLNLTTVELKLLEDLQVKTTVNLNLAARRLREFLSRKERPSPLTPQL